MFFTTTPDILADLTCSDCLSGLSYELFYSAGLLNFIYNCQQRFYWKKMPLKRTIESFFIIRASPRRSYQCIETETAERMKEKLGEGG